MNNTAEKLEPFITGKEVIDSGLFHGLTYDRLKAYSTQKHLRSHGPAKCRTYLLSEVYEWSPYSHPTRRAYAR